jgi:hypothetical protein
VSPNRLRHMVIEIRLPKPIIGQDSIKARSPNLDHSRICLIFIVYCKVGER